MYQCGNDCQLPANIFTKVNVEIADRGKMNVKLQWQE